MIYLYSFFLLLTAPILLYFVYSTYKRVSIEYKTLLIYTIGITILPGVILAPYINEISDRLISISQDTTIIITLFSFYYLFIFITPIYLWAPKNRKELPYFGYENVAAKVILTLTLLYLAIRIIIFYENLPLLYLIKNDLLNAARYRQLAQNKIIAIDIPYIGATFKIFTSIITYYFFYQWIKNNRGAFLFFISLTSTSIYLMLDTQKAPIFIVIINLAIIYLNVKKINIKLVIGSLISVVSLLFLVTSLNGSDDFYLSLFSIYDRVILGQIQSMYYMFEFLTPNANGITYDFYFSSLLDNSTLPPNIKVIPYIPLYEGNDTLVNVNTFYLGDVWGYLGWFGMILAPWLVFIIFSGNILIFKKGHNSSLYIFLFMAYFSFYPLNRSFSEIIFLKYLLHYIIFGLIPLFLIINISKKIGRT